MLESFLIMGLLPNLLDVYAGDLTKKNSPSIPPARSVLENCFRSTLTSHQYRNPLPWFVFCKKKALKITLLHRTDCFDPKEVSLLIRAEQAGDSIVSAQFKQGEHGQNKLCSMDIRE